MLCVAHVDEHQDRQHEHNDPAAVHAEHGRQLGIARKLRDHLAAGGRSLPRATLQPLDDTDDDVVHHQGEQRFVRVPLRLEEGGDEGPQAAAQDRGYGHDEQQRKLRHRLAELQRKERRADGACGDLALCADVPEVHLEARGDGQRAAEQGNGDLDGLADERLRPERAVDDRAIGLQRGIAEGEQQQAADDQGEHDGRDADGPRRSGMYPVDPAGELELACGFFVHVDSLPSDLGHEQTDLFLCRGAGIHDAADLAAAQDQNAVTQLQQHVEVLTDEHDG